MILYTINKTFIKLLEYDQRQVLHTITVDLVIFTCLDFREFFILKFFTKSRLCELSISMIGSAYNNNFLAFLKFANLSS